jgi:hypothetical protein
MRDPADPAVTTEQFPDRAVWPSGTGRWRASRSTGLTAAHLAAGCVLYLHADDPETLASQIRAQQALRN